MLKLYSLPVCLILTQQNNLNVKVIAFLDKWKQQIKNNECFVGYAKF